jgi:hypothetical protein
MKISAPITKIFNSILEEKSIHTYYFDRVNHEVVVKDISTLDAGDEDVAIAEWGGLSSFSAKASDIIAKIVATNASEKYLKATCQSIQSCHRKYARCGNCLSSRLERIGQT